MAELNATLIQRTTTFSRKPPLSQTRGWSDNTEPALLIRRRTATLLFQLVGDATSGGIARILTGCAGQPSRNCERS